MRWPCVCWKTLGLVRCRAALRDLFVQQGARFEAGRIHIPRRLIAQAIASAPKTITMHGRDAARSIQVGGIGCISVMAGGSADFGFGQR